MPKSEIKNTKCVLVTGGAGEIGSAICKKFVWNRRSGFKI
jgi:FlaA1/EpsC-like NDP-sugar epimerase